MYYNSPKIMSKNEEFIQDLILSLDITPYEITNIDSGFLIRYNQESLGVNQTLEISTIQNHIVLYTERPDFKGKAELMPSISQLIGRINDFLQIGCFELIPETYLFRLKSGQIFHPSSNCIPLIRSLIEYHCLVFPKIYESMKEVLCFGKPPIDAINTFYVMNENSNYKEQKN